MTPAEVQPSHGLQPKSDGQPTSDGLHSSRTVLGHMFKRIIAFEACSRFNFCQALARPLTYQKQMSDSKGWSLCRDGTGSQGVFKLWSVVALQRPSHVNEEGFGASSKNSFPSRRPEA